MSPSEIFAPGLLEGRVALVTGGGTGLGRAAAAELRACGAEVVISGRRREVLDETAAELRAHAVDGDVREPAGAERMVRSALERCGRPGGGGGRPRAGGGGGGRRGPARSPPRRWVARSRARWSRSTARATTGSARGRRRRSPRTAARCRRRRGSRPRPVERRRAR